MRKGRSQRKARVSLPPRAARSKPSHADVGSEPGPQVVIGVTGPRPEPADVNARSESSPEAQRATRSTRPTLEMLAEPMLERVREAERLERVEEELRAAVPPSAESPYEASELRDRAEPLRTELPRVETVVPMTAELVTIASASHDETPLGRDGFPASDEISIPPVGDLAVEPMADRFFSEGEIVAARASAEEHEHEWAEVVARESRKSLPEVVERRARLAKYVRWAVGGAAILCLAAVGRTFVAPATHASLSAASSVNALGASANLDPPEPKAAAAAVVATPPPAPAETAAAEPAKTAEVAAAPAAEPTDPARVDAPRVDIPKAEAPPAVAASADDKANALKEKNDSRRALERGKSADAIAAGERSVALDPSDGEAWLLLGAAYQDKGNMAEARRAYTACTKEGTRGPIGECRAMLR